MLANAPDGSLPPPAILVAGLGCRRGCTAPQLRELLLRGLDEAGCALSDLTALASVAHKADEPGLLRLASELGLPLVCVPASDLAAFYDRLSRRSTLAAACTGSHGVAESAALAVAERLGSGPAHLRLERRNDTVATVAVAMANRLETQ